MDKVEKFIVPDGRKGTYKYKKYIAIMKDGERVPFGDRRFEHYKDSVPVKKGGGKWKHLNHLDKKRRDNFRARHAGILLKDGRRAIDVKYSSAWFSYYYLW